MNCEIKTAVLIAISTFLIASTIEIFRLYLWPRVRHLFKSIFESDEFDDVSDDE